jgi:hypothetical protein
VRHGGARFHYLKFSRLRSNAVSGELDGSRAGGAQQQVRSQSVDASPRVARLRAVWLASL